MLMKRFKQLFDEAGIKYTESNMILTVEAGYVGFVIEFSFDSTGSVLLSYGAYE